MRRKDLDVTENHLSITFTNSLDTRRALEERERAKLGESETCSKSSASVIFLKLLSRTKLGNEDGVLIEHFL